MSGIIDKFGQGAAGGKLEEIEEKEEEEGQGTSEQQMVLDLARENEELNEYIHQI